MQLLAIPMHVGCNPLHENAEASECQTHHISRHLPAGQAFTDIHEKIITKRTLRNMMDFLREPAQGLNPAACSFMQELPFINIRGFFMRHLIFVGVLAAASAAHAADPCELLPDHAALKAALKDARGKDNGGLNLDMWGTIVARDGTVCNVAYTGETVDAQWPGSRAISAQKANTANAFSLKGLALSTANLYSVTQPGGSLFGLQASNPVDTSVAYSGASSAFGSETDPMVGKRIGGVNVFGGGLALYDAKGAIVGALGVSGDTSCADHNIAWHTRHGLKLDYVPAGLAKDKTDAIIYDIAGGKSAGGFGHPDCGGKEQTAAKSLPAVAKVK
jgi:uncharacterized protein GlcG (DUF336 family)